MKLFVSRRKRKPVQFYVGNGNRFYRSSYLTEKAFLHDLKTMKGKGVDVGVVYDDGTTEGIPTPKKE